MNKTIFILILPLIMLVACGQGPAAVHLHATEPDIVGGWSSGAQKPGASVRFYPTEMAIDTSDRVVVVPLELQVGHASGELILQLSDSPDFDIVEGDLERRLTLDGSATYYFPLTLYFPAPGRFYLPVNVMVELPNGKRSQRSLSVILQVGPELERKGKTASTTQLTPEGEWIQPLPAAEQIR